ncbi:MAG TPA: DUF1566 domain-containing protein, partial [Polyangiaceae bacterium]
GDAADAADARLDVATPDAWPVPTGNETWAHWRMPNPDASVGPDGAPPPPNPMAYDAGADASADGGSPVAVDTVTGLAWVRASFAASTYDAAWIACTTQTSSSPSGASWRVPTRIELVSLVDFTRQPTIDPNVFPGAQSASYWTSSTVPGDGGPSGWWTVNFSSGLVATVAASASALPTYVLCVSGGTP